MFSANTQALLLSLGVIFIGFGLTACLGYWKNWYWRGGGTPYGYIPLGGILILYGFQDTNQNVFRSELWFITLLVLLILVGVWWMLRPPAFLKPRWVHWIEKYPNPVRNAMRKAAAEGTEWVSKVSSEAAVDAWAKTFNH